MKRTNARVHLELLAGVLALLAATVLQVEARSLPYGQEPVPSNPALFSIPNGGGVSMTTSGASDSTVVGYGRLQADNGIMMPSALAIFEFRRGNVTVSEAGVPASKLILSGRIYADVNGPVNTGLAIVNPNNAPVSISFFFTDENGTDSGYGVLTIPENGQVAGFLDQAPFNGGSAVSGTFTFTASLPVSAIALRGFMNERSDFLLTALPVANLSVSQTPGETIVFPHFADGGGWTTQMFLVNPTDAPLMGTVSFLDSSGQAVAVTIDGQTSESFPYVISPRSSRRLQTVSGSGQVQTGSVRVVSSAGDGVPSGVAVFSFRSDGITVTQAGIPASRPGSAFRQYAETLGSFAQGQAGSTQTGFAITNLSDTPATVNVELTDLAGDSLNLFGRIDVPGNGQVAGFLNQITGLHSISNFRGVLRISTTASPGIAVAGLRGRFNERGDFLIASTPAADETSGLSGTEAFFPHFADGGGYTTQFILFNGAGQPSSGVLRFFTQGGLPLEPVMR